MPELMLAGCTPEPLMGYLKSLGVFRLVAEQADAAATLAWRGGVACLDTKLDSPDLQAFLLNKYRPTAVLAPWNGGSGFYGGGAEPLDAIAGSTTLRLSAYRQAIATIRRFSLGEKPRDEEKESLLVRCRAELSDDVVPWLDTCFVLGEIKPAYFPLLGTGGNDGRLDFTNNFFQRLADVIPFHDEPAPAQSAGWLDAALFADSLAPLGRSAIGQFNPGGIGGANGTQGKFEADSRVNPWEFVLMIEGALLFAGSSARRLGSNMSAKAAFPFSVESVAIGYGSATASEETTDGSRAELWLPLWNQQSGLAELSQLFAEGRAQFGRRQAKNSVEFALAACTLGVSRGIETFSRYGFLKRNGLAFLAAPLGRVAVTPRPQAQLLSDPPLLEWYDRLRRACNDKDKTPQRYQSALRSIDRSMYEFAVRSESGRDSDRRALVEVLRSIGRAERVLSRGLKFCADKFLNPLQGLNSQWLRQANDDSSDSTEFRLAAAIASIGDCDGVGPLRVHLEEVEPCGSRFNWSPGSTSAVWAYGGAADNLIAVLQRRHLEAFRNGAVGIPLKSPVKAPLADVVAFLHGETNDEKLVELLWALVAIQWNREADDFNGETASNVDIPFEFGMPRLLIEPLAVIAEGDRWIVKPHGEPTVYADPDVLGALTVGGANAVLQCADRSARRLKSCGKVVHGYRNRGETGKSLNIKSTIDARRFHAAMLFPLSPPDLQAIANLVLFPPQTEGRQ